MEPIEIRINLRIMVGSGPDPTVLYTVGKGEWNNEVVVAETKGEIKSPQLSTNLQLKCYTWGYAIGDKKAKSCDGCKIACPVKGRYKGEQISI